MSQFQSYLSILLVFLIIAQISPLAYGGKKRQVQAQEKQVAISKTLTKFNDTSSLLSITNSNGKVISFLHKTGDQTYFVKSEQTCVFEAGTSWLVSRLLQNKEFFINIGVNYGIHSIQAALTMQNSNSKKTSRIDAYEANPPVFRYLEESIKLNNLSTIVHPINKGVFNESGQLNFEITKQMTGAHIVSEPTKKSIKVPVVLLDEVYNVTQKVDLLEVDTEGAECSILRGGEKLIKAQMFPIIMEFNKIKFYVKKGFSQRYLFDCLTNLTDLGYSLYIINSDQISPFEDKCKTLNEIIYNSKFELFEQLIPSQILMPTNPKELVFGTASKKANQYGRDILAITPQSYELAFASTSQKAVPKEPLKEKTISKEPSKEKAVPKESSKEKVITDQKADIKPKIESRKEHVDDQKSQDQQKNEQKQQSVTTNKAGKPLQQTQQQLYFQKAMFFLFLLLVFISIPVICILCGACPEPKIQIEMISQQEGLEMKAKKEERHAV